MAGIHGERAGVIDMPHHGKVPARSSSGSSPTIKPYRCGMMLAVLLPSNTSIMERMIDKSRQRREQRRTMINEIHFTHSRLERLLRAMAPRESNGRSGPMLGRQLAHEQQALRMTIEIALDMGMPPGPCVCAESEAILGTVHHADRLDRRNAQRDRRIAECMGDARMFIIRRWGALLDNVELEEGPGPLFDRVLHLQSDEADRHRELVRMIGELQSNGGSRRSA